MTQRRDAYVEGSCDGYSRGFAAGHAHAREQVAAQLEDRADGLTGEHAGLADAELREQAEKIRIGK